jgi:hypothetical protein
MKISPILDAASELELKLDLFQVSALGQGE